MIGLFTVASIPDAATMCRAKSAVVDGVEGAFYIPVEYRPAVSALRNGDRFFGILDDASGLGAMLFKLDDGIVNGKTLNVNNDVAIGGEVRITGETTAVGDVVANANLTVHGTIHGSNPSASITLTAAHAAAIVAAAAAGTPVTLEAVPLILR